MAWFVLAEREGSEYSAQERREMTLLLKSLSVKGTLETESRLADEYGQLNLFGDARRVYCFRPRSADFPDGYRSAFSNYILFQEGCQEPVIGARRKYYMSEKLLHEIPEGMPIEEGLQRIHDVTGVRKHRKKSMKKLGREAHE